MGALSINKGKRLERTLCQLLSLELGIKCVRNLAQTRDGGVTGDVVGAHNFAIECKGGPAYLAAWWRQTLLQATDGRLPALAYKLDRYPWVVKVRAHDVIPELACEPDETVDMTLPAFCVLVRERISAAALRAA